MDFGINLEQQVVVDAAQQMIEAHVIDAENGIAWLMDNINLIVDWLGTDVETQQPAR